MGESTAIAWCDHTFNPWWGCTKIEGPNGTGSACDNCYAATFAKRTGHDVWGKDGDRRLFGDKHWDEPLRWEKQAAAGIPGPNTGRADHLVFCASMADVFEARDDLDEHRARLWALIAATPHLTWLLLTKRPEQIIQRVPPAWFGADESGMVQVDPTHLVPVRYCSPDELVGTSSWPANVWIGTTVEDQARADLRLPRLARIPAPVHFISGEPLLGPIDLLHHVEHVEWVIVGGESGNGHRPLDLDAVRSLLQQCATWDVPFFFKQVGGRTPAAGGDELDGARWKEFPSR